MKSKILGLLAAGLLAGPMAANAVSYVGVYRVTDGPGYATIPTVYSAVEAAALVFGAPMAGSHYEISVLGADPSSITNTAWYAVVAVGPGVYAEGYKLDGGKPGYAADFFSDGPVGIDASAYVDDPFFDPDQGYNYVFLVPDQVPEPGTLALLGLGLAGLGVTRRRKAD